MNKIKVRKNGPLLCEGQIELYDSDGELIEATDNVALCRCGKSVTSPYCNGSHEKEFEDDGQFSDEKIEELGPDFPLKISCRKNAMYSIKGPVEIVSHDGESQTTRNKVILCRCGLSENKPFCDGSHKAYSWEQPY